MALDLPTQGFVFWPVGTGDSITIGIHDGVIMQIDLHSLACADDEADPRTPLLDKLIPLLPKRAGKPYLPLFVLTHPDKDHCLGFAELLERVTIGELWFSPRIFWEYKVDLCDDAVAFRDEARRRVSKTIDEGGLPASGDRVRIIGYSDLLKEKDFRGFPEDLLTVPGNTITGLDGVDYAGTFGAFVHAPFKDDASGERNDTSLAFQITLNRGAATGRALLLGDLCYPTVKKIFQRSEEEGNEDRLEWNVFLAPHHCSKSVMYWQEEGEADKTLKQDVLDMIEAAARPSGYIVASSQPVPASNQAGDNPPHAKAKARYEELVEAGHFLCTMEHGGEASPEPIVFWLGETKLEYRAVEGAQTAESAKSQTVEAAIAAARGVSEPPVDRVGFGAR